jgi:hydroxyacylglutathione hydrolase
MSADLVDAADPLYFRQLLAGDQVAQNHPVAGRMANFMYLIGDRARREAWVVDPAWDVESLLAVAERDGYTVRGALVTHYHPDHVGGDLFGLRIEGIGRLLERVSVPIYVNKHEADGLKQVTGVSESDLKRVDDGDRVRVGDVEAQFLHTPGHTPGSQCFLVGNRLVAGDTLFVQGCGRVDLPGGDSEVMYHTLTGKLAKLPADTVLFPGHHYGPSPTSTIGEELTSNHYLRVRSLADWRRLMG